MYHKMIKSGSPKNCCFSNNNNNNVANVCAIIEDTVVKHKSVHDRMLHDIFIVRNDNEGCLAHFRFAALPWNKDLNCCVGIRLCKLGYSGIIYCAVNTRKKLPQSITQEVFNFSNHLNGSIIRSRAAVM